MCWAVMTEIIVALRMTVGLRVKLAANDLRLKDVGAFEAQIIF